MKRALIYIFSFFIICAALLGTSKLTNTTIMAFYTPDLINELSDTFTSKDTIHIDGKMLSIYLNTSGEKFTIDGKQYERFGGDKQYNKLKNGFYKVERIGTPYEDYLQISSEQRVSDKMVMLKTLFNMNRTMMYKTIFFNVLTILAGIGLFILYEYKGRKVIVIEGN